MEEKENNMPITIARQDFINNIASIINTSGLPAFVMKEVLKDMYNQLVELEKKELERDLAEYQSSQAESEGEEKSDSR